MNRYFLPALFRVSSLFFSHDSSCFYSPVYSLILFFSLSVFPLPSFLDTYSVNIIFFDFVSFLLQLWFSFRINVFFFSSFFYSFLFLVYSLLSSFSLLSSPLLSSSTHPFSSLVHLSSFSFSLLIIYLTSYSYILLHFQYSS